MAASEGFQPAPLLKKETSDVFLWILQTFARTYFPFDRTPPDDCFLCLSVNSKTFFRTLLLKSTSGKLLFLCTTGRISTTRCSKKLFHRSFSSILYKIEGSHSKGFIYLKSLKTVCEEVNLLQSCEMPTCKLTKKTLSHIVLHALRLHFLRIHHNYIFRRGLESLRAQFLSGSVSGK